MRPVDIEQAQRFLTLLDEGAEAFAFRTLGAIDRNHTGTLDALAAKLTLANGKGDGVYVVVNAGGHDTASITRVRAVFADCDTPGAPWPECPLDPHIIVESSPGKWHAYWLVDGLPLEMFGPVQRAIAARFATDPSVIDLPRIMRLPGFMHTKGEPFQTRIIHESGAVPYSAAAILAEFPPAAATPPKAQAPAVHGMIPDGERDTTLTSLAGSMRRRGMSEAAMLAALRVENETRCAPPLDDAQVVKIARSIGRKEPAPQAKPAPAPAVGNASELMRRTFQPVQWAVQGILPEGITILSGDPKIGKSWLLYQACVAVATGRPLWIGREPESAGDALMLALEDNDRRLQRRLTTLLPRFSTFKGTRIINPDVSRLHYATQWPRGEAGALQLGEWLHSHPDCRLVVIDTVSAFRDPDPGKKSAYAHDYAVGELFKPLARDYSCAIVLVMHNRKQHSADALQLVSGTQGMTGGVDNVLVLRRERGQLDAGLYVDGRDIEEPQEMALRFDAGYWCGTGQSVEEAKLSKERRRVLEAIDALGAEARSRAICDQLLPARPGTIRTLLAKMVKAGQLQITDGVYTHTGTAVTAVTREAAA